MRAPRRQDMNKRLFALPGLATLTLAFSLVPLAACAQVPVDEHGEVLGDYRQPSGECRER